MKLIFVIVALAASFAMPSFAQERCGLTEIIETALGVRYGETVIDSREIDHSEHPGVRVTVQLWVNEESGTWTLTVKAPDGSMCMYAAGRNYSGQTLNDFLTSDVEA